MSLAAMGAKPAARLQLQNKFLRSKCIMSTHYLLWKLRSELEQLVVMSDRQLDLMTLTPESCLTTVSGKRRLTSRQPERVWCGCMIAMQLGGSFRRGEGPASLWGLGSSKPDTAHSCSPLVSTTRPSWYRWHCRIPSLCTSLPMLKLRCSCIPNMLYTCTCKAHALAAVHQLCWRKH